MKKFQQEDGFTLIEMLIVLLIISVLILITVPNVGKHFKTIDEKGCDAYISMVQGQIEAYRVNEMTYPTMSDLVSKGYLKTNETSCPNGEKVTISDNGEAILDESD